jgi:hypothetical protein
MLFVFRFSCLFTFHKHKQRQEVTRPREIATDSTFLTGLYCKQTKEPKERRNRENRGFTKLAFSLPCRVRLICNLVGTSGQVLGIVWYVCFVYTIVCLHFVNINKEITLYGFLGRLYIKCFETWWCSFLTHNSVEPVF